MDWTTPVDIYCERTDATFWAEPVNALSNLAFVLASLIAIYEARRTDRLDGLIAALCFLAAAVGVGSFLFHTFAQSWAGLADVIPILLFILLYLSVAVNRFFDIRWPLAVPLTVTLFVVSLPARNAALWLSGGRLNGSESYAPALALLIGSAVGLAAIRHPAASWIALATGVFMASLTARVLDASICEAFPLGTHFLWHLLNGTMIGILLLAMIRFGRLPDRKGNDIG